MPDQAVSDGKSWCGLREKESGPWPEGVRSLVFFNNRLFFNELRVYLPVWVANLDARLTMGYVTSLFFGILRGTARSWASIPRRLQEWQRR